jgi:MFS family permease
VRARASPAGPPSPEIVGKAMSTAEASAAPKPPPSFAERLKEAVVTPVKALRWRYVPLLMVYFAYGAYVMLPAVALSFWRREALTLTPAELAAIAVWLSLPWTIKMVFGQFVDAIPILGSRRKAYVYLGATLMAAGFVVLAGAAGKWLTFASADALYVIAMLSMTLGVVLQDVVADAMSTEVVARADEAGNARPQADINAELAMVQVLGRLALLFGLFATAGLGGYLATIFPYEQVFLISLVVPVISVAGVVLVRLETGEPGPIDWRVLGGGLAFGAVVVALGVFGVPYGQEIVFLMSMAVICALLVTVTAELDHDTRLQILFATIVIFAFRATPTTGEGYTWFQMDVLKFDEEFFGVLAQLSSTFAILGMWLLAATIVRKPIAWTMLWLTVIYAILSFPNLALYYGVYEWTDRVLGIDARDIALIDTATESPFAQLSMIPLLTLIAIYAPPGKRATWFALMASLLNLALTAGTLQTKYLNQIFHVDRNQYGELGALLITVIVLNFVVPIAAIVLFGHRIAQRKA